MGFFNIRSVAKCQKLKGGPSDGIEKFAKSLKAEKREESHSAEKVRTFCFGILVKKISAYAPNRRKTMPKNPEEGTLSGSKSVFSEVFIRQKVAIVIVGQNSSTKNTSENEWSNFNRNSNGVVLWKNKTRTSKAGAISKAQHALSF